MKRLCAVLVALAFVALAAPVAHANDYGKCSFASDCHPNVKCNSSRCADSAGSSCSSGSCKF